MTNADIADRLLALAQLLAAQKDNPFKVKAYRRAAKSVTGIGDSLEDDVRSGRDLTDYPGIGEGIAAVIREIVQSGASKKLQSLREQVKPEIAALSDYPRLDPARVLRVYKRLKIASVGELRDKLASGEIKAQCGVRMEQHIRQGLTTSHEILLYDADKIAPQIASFLTSRCGAVRVEPAGAYRRRTETVEQISLLVLAHDFPDLLHRVKGFGGGIRPIDTSADHGEFELSSGVGLNVYRASVATWGLDWIRTTGSEAHIRKLGPNRLDPEAEFRDEVAVYRALGLDFIEPELREGLDEVDRAGRGEARQLIATQDILGELHAHTTSSDGVHTIERMTEAAAARGYRYIGISDHSQSLKIARGLSIDQLRAQLGRIDDLNGRTEGIRILKSAEVDILEDGSLDYPDEVLRELDYTVCSIHSRFALGKDQQTSRILRAMDNPYFTILGHATGRLLLKRPGYELDIDRVIRHARDRGCFFEMNSSPDRLDLSAANARLAREAGVRIAITTDAHSTHDYSLLRCGIDQARRAGLTKADVLNTMPIAELAAAFRKVRAA